jgi:phosphatidylserine synthase
MTDTSMTSHDKRGLWVRGLLMILMAIAFHISGMLLAVGAIVQFVLALVSDGPNARLIGFGQSLGRYLGQIADFVSFATEEVPFPFTAWPSR